jgi:hypothetical protein
LHCDIKGESFKPREILLTSRPAADFRLPSEIIRCPVSYQQGAN